LLWVLPAVNIVMFVLDDGQSCCAVCNMATPPDNLTVGMAAYACTASCAEGIRDTGSNDRNRKWRMIGSLLSTLT
jgi:hypothetical protein